MNDLARRFLDHLRAELGEPGLEYAEPPMAISGGYDAQVFSFRLNTIHEGWARPLILRLLGVQHDPRRAVLESVIQNTVATLGYPAPRAIAATADTTVLGGAFLVMARGLAADARRSMARCGVDARRDAAALSMPSTRAPSSRRWTLSEPAMR